MTTMLASLTPTDKIQLAIAVVTGVAVIVAAITAWLSIVNERKRTQPVIITHEARQRLSTTQLL